MDKFEPSGKYQIKGVVKSTKTKSAKTSGNKSQNKTTPNDKICKLDKIVNINKREYVEKEIWVQWWIESERGYGQREDGISLHLTKEDCDSFIAQYWKSQPKETPEVYSRPDSSPKSCIGVLNKTAYNKLVQSKNGIRVYTYKIATQITVD